MLVNISLGASFPASLRFVSVDSIFNCQQIFTEYILS